MQDRILVGSSLNHIFFNPYFLIYEDLWLKFQHLPLLYLPCQSSQPTGFRHQNTKILIQMQLRTLSLNYEGQKLHRTEFELPTLQCPLLLCSTTEILGTA